MLAILFKPFVFLVYTGELSWCWLSCLSPLFFFFILVSLADVGYPVKPFVFLVPKDLWMIWLSSLLTIRTWERLSQVKVISVKGYLRERLSQGKVISTKLDIYVLLMQYSAQRKLKNLQHDRCYKYFIQICWNPYRRRRQYIKLL